MGRPTLLTPDTQTHITTLLTNGIPLERAAQTIGIARSTAYDWARRGRAEAHRIAEGLPPQPDEAPYLDFADAVERATSLGEAELVARIRAATQHGGRTTKTRTVEHPDGSVETTTEVTDHPGQWTAAAWLLERRFPTRWRRRDRLDVGLSVEEAAGRLAAVVQAVVGDPDVALSPEQRAAALARLSEQLTAVSADGGPTGPA